MPEIIKIKIVTEADDKGIKETTSSFEKMTSSFERGGELVGAAILGAGAGVTAFGVASISAAADMEQQQIAFKTLLGDATKAEAFMKEIRADAAKSPFEMQPLVEMNQALLGAGLEAGKARETVNLLGNALAATGKGEAELKRVGNTMSQVFGKGKADSVDFKELVNAGWVSVKQDVSQTLGVTMAQLEDLVSNGEIGFSELQQSLQRVSGEGGKFGTAMADQSQSVNGLMSTLKDNVKFAMADIGKALIDGFNIKGVISGAIPALEQFVAVLRDQVIPFIQDNQGIIVIFTGTVLAALAWGFKSVAINALAAVGSMLLFLTPFVLVGAALTILYLAWNNNWGGIRDKTQQVVDWFQNSVWPTFKKVFDWIGTLLTTLGQIFTNIWNLVIKPLLQAFVSWLSTTWITPITTTFQLIGKKLSEMGVTWETVFNGIKSIVFGIMGAIVDMVKDKVNFIIRAINAVISGANSAGDNIPGFTKINTIPQFANGVSNFKGGAAIVGEQGPELVTLPRGSSVTPNGEFGGNTFNITQNIYDSMDMDKAMRDLAYAVETS